MFHVSVRRCDGRPGNTAETTPRTRSLQGAPPRIAAATRGALSITME